MKVVPGGREPSGPDHLSMFIHRSIKIILFRITLYEINSATKIENIITIPVTGEKGMAGQKVQPPRMNFRQSVTSRGLASRCLFREVPYNAGLHEPALGSLSRQQMIAKFPIQRPKDQI